LAHDFLERQADAYQKFGLIVGDDVDRLVDRIVVECVRVEFRAEAFNVLNKTNLQNAESNLSSAS